MRKKILDLVQAKFSTRQNEAKLSLMEKSFLLATIGSVCFSLEQRSWSRFMLPITTKMGGTIRRRWHAVPCLIILLQKRRFTIIANGLLTSTQRCLLILTQVFSGGLTTEKSAGSTKELSNWSSTLQHHLTISARDIASRVNLVGSFMPSYRKAGCF